MLIDEKGGLRRTEGEQKVEKKEIYLRNWEEEGILGEGLVQRSSHKIIRIIQTLSHCRGSAPRKRNDHI